MSAGNQILLSNTYKKKINEERCSLDVSLGLEVVSLMLIYFVLHVCVLRCREKKGHGCFSCLGAFCIFEPEFIFVVLLVLIGSPEDSFVYVCKMDDQG